MTDLRVDMVQRIVNSEARRNAQGEILVYQLPTADGGGTYEVAGVNERYHPEKAYQLRMLVEAGKPVQAEREAREYIAEYTDGAGSISEDIGLSYNLRDCAWNRGPTGAIKILQIALQVEDDGVFGPISTQALNNAMTNVEQLLKDVRAAREAYERSRGRDESSTFWQGLANRWDRVLAEGLAYNNGTISPISIV